MKKFLSVLMAAIIMVSVPVMPVMASSTYEEDQVALALVEEECTFSLTESNGMYKYSAKIVANQYCDNLQIKCNIEVYNEDLGWVGYSSQNLNFGSGESAYYPGYATLRMRSYRITTKYTATKDDISVTYTDVKEFMLE